MNINGYEFIKAESAPKDVKRSSCVYLIERDGVVVYVGSSSDAYSRVCQHKCSGLFVDGDSIFYHENESTISCRFIERDIIKSIKPKLNKVYNPDVTIREKTKRNVTRTLSYIQIERADKLAKSKGVSQSEIIGDAVDMAFYQDCADREGISLKEWLAKEDF